MSHADAKPHTDELLRHHDVEAPDRERARYRIRTRLDWLLAEGLTDKAGWTAGVNYRRDMECGELGGAPGRDEGMGTATGGGDPTQARLDALRRLAQARAVLTVHARAAVDGLVIDMDWTALGRVLFPHLTAQPWAIHRARECCKDALADLARHYGLNARERAPMCATHDGTSRLLERRRK